MPYQYIQLQIAAAGDAAVNLDAITTASASDLKLIADSFTGAGNGDLDIANVGRITGLISDVNAVLADGDINNRGNQNVTITDAEVSATALATLIGDVENNNNLTTGNVDIISSSISGNATLSPQLSIRLPIMVMLQNLMLPLLTVLFLVQMQ